MKKITEITNEREFISKLRTYYRKGRRKGYQRDEISFLGLMEYIGSATSEFEYQSDKYFSVGIRAYDWVHGNSLLSALIDKWENEIEAEKRKKQHTQPTEAPRISTEAAETVNVSVEGEEEDKPRKIDQIKIRRVYGDMFCVSMYVDGKLVDCENGITESQKDKIQNLFDNGKLFASIQPPRSPETPQTVDCATDTPKPRETARKPQNRGIGNTRCSGLGANGYAMLGNASATLAAMSVPRECSTADAAYW